MERFWNKITKRGPNECWEWNAGLSKNGRPLFWYEGRMVIAYRFVFALMGTPIPDRLLACHHCDNPRCCNPAHIFIGTKRDNLMDYLDKGGKVGKSQRGEANPAAKLALAQVNNIRSSLREGVSRRSLALSHKVAIRTIDSIANGQTWREGVIA